MSFKKWLPLIPVLLGLAIYFPALSYGYVWDDHYFFDDGDFFLRVNLGDNFLSALPLWRNNIFYRPLTQVLFSLQFMVGSGDPFIFHAVSLFVFLMNSVLVTGIVYRVLFDKQQKIQKNSVWFLSVIAGVLYVVHPAMVETVCWISSQFDLQMTFWLLLLIFISTFQKPVVISFLASAIFYFCASASKEGCVLFAPVFIIFHFLRWGGCSVPAGSFSAWLKGRQWLPDLLGILAGGALYWALRFSVLEGNISSMFAAGILDIVFNALRALFWYLKLSLLPFYGMGLHFEDGKEYFTVEYAVAGGAALLIIIALLRIYFVVGLIAISFLIALAPALLTTAAGFSSTFINDRYLSYPIAIMIVQLCILAGNLSPTLQMTNFFRMLLKSIAIVLMLFMAFYSSMLVKAWRSDLVMWVLALEENPASQYARGQVVGYYAQFGHCDKAIEIAAQQKTSTIPAAVSLASNCRLKDNPESVIKDMNAILESPGNISGLDLYSVLNTLALAHAALHQYEKSIEIYRDLLEAFPGRYKLRLILSEFLLRACKEQEAQKEFTLAMTSVPGSTKKLWLDVYNQEMNIYNKNCKKPDQ